MNAPARWFSRDRLSHFSASRMDVGRCRGNLSNRRRFLSESWRLEKGKRRGVTAVEFAFVAPVFFLLVFGIVEFGRLMMVQQLLTNASREGVRRAVVEGVTATEVKQFVSDYLTNASVSGSAATINVTPTTLDTVGFGDAVSVSVSLPYADVSWVPSPWFLEGTTLTANSVMRGERLQ